MSIRSIRAAVALAALVALTFLVACTAGGSAGGSGSSSASGTGAPNAVTIKSFSFDPASVEVKTGTKVTWTNEDSTAHTVTSDTGAFNGTLEPGKSFSFTFTTAGSYPYHCSIHPSMVGQVVVK